jgi:hypothetical protein
LKLFNIYKLKKFFTLIQIQTRQTDTSDLLERDRGTIGQIHQKIRLVTSRQIDKSNIVLGGVGKVVEIDESLFVKVKHHKGKDLHRLNSSEMKRDLVGLTLEERCQVHQLAEKFNLQHSSKDINGERVLTIAKQEAIMGTPRAAKNVRSELLVASNYAIQDSPKVAETINAVAEVVEGAVGKKKRGRPPKNTNKCTE